MKQSWKRVMEVDSAFAQLVVVYSITTQHEVKVIRHLEDSSLIFKNNGSIGISLSQSSDFPGRLP